jgi:hypothetical protein
MSHSGAPRTGAVRGPAADDQPRAASGRRRRVGGPAVADVVLATVVGLAVLVVHDVPYLLHHSYWVDEAWVADTVRTRIGLTWSLASSTPLGWTYLLRLVPFGGPQRLRLVPLAFAMLAAAAGYLFGRELRLTRFATGVLTGAAVLLSPAMLVRDDLKQYTAEAFACLVLWVLVARIENEWRRRRLVAIAATASLGMLFANTVIFVGVAAMACLALECLVTRHYRRLAEVAVAAAGMLVVAFVIYETLIHPQVTHNLVAYWDPFYMPTTSASAAVSFLHLQLHQLAPYMGFPLLADVLLVLAGIAALAWLRRPALAALLPVTLVIVIAASAAREYPFGDVRTSTFWLVTVPLLMAVAVAAAAHLAGEAARRASRDREARWALLVPLVVAALALAVWVPATDSYVRSHDIPNEDVHSEVTYLDHHFRRGDVIIVSYAASYAFAYYYPVANPVFRADPVGPDAHIPAYPGAPWIVVMPNRRDVDVARALAAARARIAAEPAGARGRIWIIRSHLQRTEIRAWRRDLAGDRVTTIRVGPEPILLYEPSRGS